jgi:hypothetical protein
MGRNPCACPIPEAFCSGSSKPLTPRNHGFSASATALKNESTEPAVVTQIPSQSIDMKTCKKSPKIWYSVDSRPTELRPNPLQKRAISKLFP